MVSRRKRSAVKGLAILVACGALAGGALAHTWRVGGDGADFDEIQPAIDAAAPGDVILVRPVKSYLGFELAKGVTVSATDAHFEILPRQAIAIRNVSGGAVARLSAVQCVAIGASFPLRIEDCAGTVVIDDLLCGSDRLQSGLVRIQRCAFVQITGLVAIDSQAPGGPQAGESGAVCIDDSNVLLTDLQVTGASSWAYDSEDNGFPGAAGLVVTSSRLVVARSCIQGGLGSPGGSTAGRHGPGGPGGPALLASKSSVLLLGSNDDVLLGGAGGPGGEGGGWRGPGGDGAPAVACDDGVTVSGVDLVGGSGGEGNPEGREGEPFVGIVRFVSPPFPTLDMQGQIHPGTRFHVIVHGDPDAPVIMLAADLAGWIDLPGWLGPPLSCVPGSFFVGLQAGALDSTGQLILALTLIDDAVLQGLALTTQAVVLTPRGLVLTNAATRVVGE